MRAFLFCFFVSFLFLLFACGETPAPPAKPLTPAVSDFTPGDLQVDSLLVDSIFRSFEFYVPVKVTARPSLVFVLHGSNGTVADTRRYTGYEFEKLATQRARQIIVYPKGYDKHWNDCRMHASYKANQEDINDIAFFSEMIEYFYQKHQINKEAVFATGISNGGHMCYKLAFELPDKIKGIAPFVANIPEMNNNDCTPQNEAVSVLIINGTNDPINPHGGGWVVIRQDSSRGAVMSTDNSVKYWTALAAFNDAPKIIEYKDLITDDSSTVVHYKYSGKHSDKKVELLKVINGGHTVPLKDTPPIPERFQKIVGNKNRDINAPKIVLDFFESLVE